MNYHAGLTITTESKDMQTNALRVMTGIASDLAVQFSNMNVLAYVSSEEETELSEGGEYFDEFTSLKVMKALKSTGLPTEAAVNLVNVMRDAGILFREAVSDKKKSVLHRERDGCYDPSCAVDHSVTERPK